MSVANVFNPFDTSIQASDYDAERLKFMQSFGLQDLPEGLLCYNSNPTSKMSGMIPCNKLEIVVSENMKGSDAYFYINGGTKQSHISKAIAFYVDLDAGRDKSTGQYLRPKEVFAIKQEFLKKIKSFAVKPSWIVDTRNGYQVYWILEESIEPGILWNGIQKKLANYFDADVRAMKINQIYRVPFTWWRKPWEGKKSYFCTTVDGYDGEKVCIHKLRDALSDMSSQVAMPASNSSEHWAKAWNKIEKEHLSTNVATAALAQFAKQAMDELAAQDAKGVEVLGENDAIPDYLEEIERDDVNESVQKMASGYMQSEDQLKLLSTVVDFLNQVSTPLYYSNNKFLSSSAKELASKVSKTFCVG